MDLEYHILILVVLGRLLCLCGAYSRYPYDRLWVCEVGYMPLFDVLTRYWKQVDVKILQRQIEVHL